MGIERAVIADLGAHDFEDRFEASINDPRRGVELSGFELEYLGEERAVEKDAEDEQLRSRL